VAVLMRKRLELVVSLLAIWRLGAVHVPLFTAFAPGAIDMRLRSSRVRLVISEPSQRAKLERGWCGYTSASAGTRTHVQA